MATNGTTQTAGQAMTASAKDAGEQVVEIAGKAVDAAAEGLKSGEQAVNEQIAKNTNGNKNGNGKNGNAAKEGENAKNETAKDETASKKEGTGEASGIGAYMNKWTTKVKESFNRGIGYGKPASTEASASTGSAQK